jgi:hypothetical protein
MTLSSESAYIVRLNRDSEPQRELGVLGHHLREAGHNVPANRRVLMSVGTAVGMAGCIRSQGAGDSPSKKRSDRDGSTDRPRA